MRLRWLRKGRTNRGTPGASFLLEATCHFFPAILMSISVAVWAGASLTIDFLFPCCEELGMESGCM